jgi:hypothetical protein
VEDRSRRWKAATTASLAGVMWLGDVGRLVGSGIDMRRRRRANGAIAIRDTDARGTDVCEDMVARAATVAAAGGRAAVGLTFVGASERDRRRGRLAWVRVGWCETLDLGERYEVCKRARPAAAHTRRGRTA